MLFFPNDQHKNYIKQHCPDFIQTDIVFWNEKYIFPHFMFKKVQKIMTLLKIKLFVKSTTLHNSPKKYLSYRNFYDYLTAYRIF